MNLLFLVVGVAWTCAASQSEEELRILVDFTVQKVGLQPNQCTAERGQQVGGHNDCSR